MKKTFLLWVSFVSDIISGVCFWSFSLRLPELGPNRKMAVLLKLISETRLESESFKPFRLSRVPGSKVMAQKQKNNQLVL